MASLRIMQIPTWRKSHLGFQVISQFNRPKQCSLFSKMARRLLSNMHITKNIEVISPAEKVTLGKNGFQIMNAKERPLLILLCWIMAKRKHYLKIAEFYMQQGFDVVAVTLTPWQCIWPTTGSQIIAADLLKFLRENENHYTKIIVHGFSIGGYVWGEVLTQMQKDLEGNNRLIQNIVGHIWDSVTDVNEFIVGFPRALAPNHSSLQFLMRNYLQFHLKAFYNKATRHYIKSSQSFHSTMIKSPALFIVSRSDTIASVESNLKVKEERDLMGVETYVKIFDKSPHVGHFVKHRNEYITEIREFLSKLELIQDEDKANAFIRERSHL